MTDESIDDSYSRAHPLAAWVRLSRGAKALLIARMVNRVGGFSMAFLAVLLTQELHESVRVAGIIVAAFGLATIPSRLAGGWLLDQIGARHTILIGLIGCAATQLILAGAHSTVFAVLGAVGLGLSYELIEPPTQALIAQESDDRTRPALFGLLFVSMTVAAVVAGGVAAVVAGWDLRVLFVIDAASCLACAAVIRGFLPDAHRRKASLAKPWRDRRLMTIFALTTVFTLIYMITVFGLPLTVVDRHIGLWVIGVNTAVSAVVAVLAQPLLHVAWLNRRDGFVAMTVGFGVLAAALGVLALASNVVAVLGFGVLGAIAEVLLMSHLYAQASRLAPPGAAGRYLAVFGVSWGIATTLAPLVIAATLRVWDGVPLWLGAAVITAALAVLTPYAGTALRPTSAGAVAAHD
ncbi:MFS transporter [Psychromicrobium xiongbiense]|uniref:MFS transporter n=1 Tax=Psychromicrobium xiongbiense TaxID=3051184 RepID=UPI00255222B8|nr:MFS transporter [Psychromicrobium sp. YIM S02556]